MSPRRGAAIAAAVVTLAVLAFGLAAGWVNYRRARECLDHGGRWVAQSRSVHYCTEQTIPPEQEGR